MEDMFSFGNPLQDLFVGTIATGIGTAYEVGKLGYGYVTDPQNRENTAQNASRFAQNFGKYTSNGRDWFFNDPAPNAATQQKAQFQQLADAKTARDPSNGRWNVRNQTGFDDERDNVIDDRAIKQQSYSQYQQKTGASAMAYDANGNSDDTNRGKNTGFVNYSSRPSDYNSVYNPSSPSEKLFEGLAKIRSESYNTYRNNNLQSQDRLTLGKQSNELTYRAKTYDSQLQSGDRQFKSLAELQAALDSNQRIERVGFDKNRVTGIVGLDANAKNLERSKFETTTKYGTQERINQYNRNTLNQTAIAEAQIKSGTYGMSKDDMAKRANDKANFDNWKARNDANFDYADRTNAQIKLGRDMANAERAYSDQRLDRQNDRAAAMARFQAETYRKDDDRNRYYSDLAVQRQQTRDDFNLRSQQIQNQIDIANKDYATRYGDASLRQQQYAATRADIGYNRSNQSSSLAF